MAERRVNPETGVIEEERWYGWTPVENAEGRQERINSETGVHEEERWHGWTAKENTEGRQERVNPETGVHEEERWYGWTGKENADGRQERVNPETGVHEEERWYGWTAKESSRREWRRPPGSPKDDSRGNAHGRVQGGPSASHDTSVGTGSVTASSGSPLVALGVVVGCFVLLGIVASLIQSGFTNSRPRSFAPTVAPPPTTDTDNGERIAVVRTLIQEEVRLREDLGWIDPPQVVLSVAATFQFGLKPYRVGTLTVFADGIEIDTPSQRGRWQFWKIQSMDIGRVLMTSFIKFKFDPIHSGSEDVSIEKPSSDFVVDAGLARLFEDIQNVYRQWIESDFGRNQLAARQRLKEVEDEIAQYERGMPEEIRTLRAAALQSAVKRVEEAGTAISSAGPSGSLSPVPPPQVADSPPAWSTGNPDAPSEESLTVLPSQSSQPEPRVGVPPTDPPIGLRVFDPQQVDTPPAVLEQTKPPGSQLGPQIAVVRIAVDVDGRVLAVRVLRAASDSVWQASALAMVWRWRFRPAMQNGVPVPCWLNSGVSSPQ